MGKGILQTWFKNSYAMGGIGLDGLNPIHAHRPGMEALHPKRKFGVRWAFMGGLDTQGTLPFGTPAELRRHTGQLLEGMSAGGGGHILAASHTIPPETPEENVFALYDTAGRAACKPQGV